MTTSIGDLPSNKLMSLALNGYNPFQPDVGIFSGAYQGFLYPNPTTLYYPGFNAYSYTEPSISPYVPSVEYTGLGIGNPGIDYKNAGHILGLLDTFARMSYGIGCWQSIHTGDETAGGQAVEISIPMTDGDGGSAPLGAGNIYPAYSEVPSDWIDGFTIGLNGVVSPDPRPRGLFPSQGGGRHIPATAPIDEVALQLLFGNRSIYSYFGMPQYFRSVIELLASSAAGLANKTSFIFTVDNPAYFNNYCHQQNFFTPPPDEHYEQETMGTAYVQCAVLGATEALKTLTGSSSYHDGLGGENEYRSMTELNSVVNLIPLQMVGATYWTDTRGYRVIFPPGGPVYYEVDDQTSREFRVASYMIADFIINVSDVPPDEDPTPGVVVIDGIATIHSLITDPTAYYFTETVRLLPVPVGSFEPGEIVTTDFGCAQEILKSIEIYISANNTYGWDGIWLGVGELGDSAGFISEVGHGADNGGDSDAGFETLDQSDLVLPFNKEITLGAGCTSIRMRAFLRNRHIVAQRPFTGSDSWVAEEYCHEHGFIVFEPGFHCHYPAGVHYNGWIDDPDSVPDNLASPNMELSFTVTGTRIAPLAFEVSL